MRPFRLLFCLLFCLLPLWGAAQAAPAPQTVRIGAFNFYPAIFQAQDGSIQGFYVDFLTEIARREGWTIEYVYGNWADGLTRIRTGEVDVLTNVAHTPERAAFMDYAKTPLLTVWAELYVPRDSDIDTIRRVHGKRIGLMKGDFNAANFRNLVEKFGIPCQYVEFGNFEEVFRAIAAGEVDGGVVNNTFGAAKQYQYGIKSSGVIFNPFDIFFTVAKGKNGQILETLDRYLAQWRKQEGSPYHQARERWAHGSASTIPVVPSWLYRSLLLLVALALIAAAFVFVLRSQVRHRTAELRQATQQLENELAERQMAQENLQEQATVLEEEIEERTRAEEALQAEMERTRQYLAIAQVIMVAFDDQARVTLINRKGHEVLGYEDGELLDKDWFRVCLPPEEYETVRGVYSRLMAGEIELVEYHENHVLTKQGERRLIAWHNTLMHDRDGRIIGSLSSGEDITERRRLEEQLRQSLKLESIGRLAGGVAHDFNNKLSVILGYAELIKQEFPDRPTVQEKLEAIITAAGHSRDITAQLLTFSRQQIVAPRPVNPNQVLRETEKTLPRLIGEDITLSYQLAPDLWNVWIDPIQLDQIIMNLAVNARDAMPHGGSFTIRTANITVDAGYGWTHPDATPGEYVQLTFCDTGQGMDQATLKHIFEPFFTTKEVGKGTGLGLATIYGIVTQNNGFVSVYSEPGLGTTFRLSLPRFAGEVIHDEQRDEQPVTGSGSILLVEDDAAIRTMIRSMLEQIGYAVLSAASPADALRIAADPAVAIDLVLSDVIMPGMDGKAMMERITQLRPNARVLFMSGYPSDHISGKGVLGSDMFFLPKPFGMQALGEKVQEALA